MNLVIDQGNTVTKVAIFDADILLDTYLYEIFDSGLCASLLGNYVVDSCVFCSVIEPSAEVLDYLNNKSLNFLFIDESTALPIQNRYKTPHTLGKDRLAAVVGANSLFPRRNVLVIDIGTAITYDFIDNNAAYLGGNISPGITIRFKGLSVFTGKLPLIERLGELPDIGYDTATAIRAGVIRGVIYEIKSYIEDYSARYPDIQIILTGGHASYVESLLDKQVFIDINLVLKGLNRILIYNVEK